jgi:hypothetical protein
MITDFAIVVLTDHQKKHRSSDGRSSSRQSGGAFRHGPKGGSTVGDRVLRVPRGADRCFCGETPVSQCCFVAISRRFV